MIHLTNNNNKMICKQSSVKFSPFRKYSFAKQDEYSFNDCEIPYEVVSFGLLNSYDESVRVCYSNDPQESINVFEGQEGALIEKSIIEIIKKTSWSETFGIPTELLFKIKEFNSLINRRKNYLDKLNDLSDDWISGNSKKPSKKAISISKDILDKILLFTRLNFTSPPKLILGPKVSGGILIQLIIDNLNSMDIEIFNSGSIKLEIETNGFYSEVGTESEDEIIKELQKII